MNARRLIFATAASVCPLVCALVVSAAPALATTPPQFAPEQVGDVPVGVAVDRASGYVYVADAWEGQVNAFESSGNLLTSFGKTLFGVEPGRHGSSSPSGVAVDNELSSLSFGDVYVVDWNNYRVDKFTASGELLLMFGGGVNEKTGGNVCAAGEACTAGTRGTANGQFEWGANTTSFIAVGPDGRVYVGDRARVQVFEPSGVWRENISLSGLTSTADVTALAVDSAGDIFVKIGDRAVEKESSHAVPGVHEFEPDGTEKATQFDAGSESVSALALDEDGDLFVADSSDGGQVLEYNPTGNRLDSLDPDTAKLVNGLAYGNGELYLSVTSEELSRERGHVWVLTPPTLGAPTIEVGSESAAPAPRGDASLAAKFNPDEYETAYHFEYIDETEFQENGYAVASSTPDVSVGASLEEGSVSAALTGLTVGATYHYRFVATNSKGTVTGPDQTFTETQSALIVGPWVSNVAATSATLGAEIDPLGVSTEYRLEYGTNTSYGEIVTGNVGEGEGYVPISLHRQGLSPNTVYHYRIVTYNELGTIEGVDHTFTTQRAGLASALPDGRQWELVSPANKKGALIEPFIGAYQIQAASDGNGITYTSAGPAVGENPDGKGTYSQVLAERGTGDWPSEDLTIPTRLPTNGEPATEILDGRGFSSEYRHFSPDLSLAFVEPYPIGTPPLSPEVTERTLYLRDNSDQSYIPLVTRANVSPPDTPIEEPELDVEWKLRFIDATPDLAHVLFETPRALTENAVEELQYPGPGVSDDSPQQNLYEWGSGELQLVDILPESEGGRSVPFGGGNGSLRVHLAGTNNLSSIMSGDVPRAMSIDGRLIAWTWGEPKSYTKGQTEYKGLYVRDTVEEKTIKIGGSEAVFQTMNEDGSKIFYVEKGDLYVYEYEAGATTDLTSDHGSDESSAGVRESVADVSEDGSHVYFVATGILAEGGIGGQYNLYALRDASGDWQTTYVTTLSQEDERSWFGASTAGAPALTRMSSRVSPDGRYLAFMSERSLTGYDNVDALSGQPDEEVFLYDAEEKKLVCASCDPTGARPVGVHDITNDYGLLVDRIGVWAESGYNQGGQSISNSNHWLAGSVPGWEEDSNGDGQTTYQPRYLSDSGRLFFNSPDALVPSATNGLEDVYEYEPAGVGSCTTTEPTFSERSDGCVNLISSGTSSTESDFYDASENGNDVFFITTSKLVNEDYDTSYDVYDAHVCSVEVPCVPAPVSPPECTTEASCRPAPTPQPEIFGPTPSATFNGVGDVVEEASGVSKTKTKSKKKAKKKEKKRKGKRKKASRTKKAAKSRAGKVSDDRRTK